MTISIDKNAKYIIEELYKHGFEGYVVGGCVRDALLNKEPHDWDITSNATPEQVKNIFKKTIDTGIKHGTVTIMINNEGYEVTTYRIDGDYDDGRHPNNVKFVSNLKDDLARRDFTINALAYNDKEGLIDYFGGIYDIQNKIIKAVGIPSNRFNEDALRMMRAIRFSAQLGFKIEQNTYKAIFDCASKLINVSKERIQTEIAKTLESKYPEKLNYVFDTGLCNYITKDFNQLKDNNITYVYSNKLYIDYTALLWNKPQLGKDILQELKLDNDTIKNTLILLSLKQSYGNDINKLNDYMEQKKIIQKIGYDLFMQYLTLVNSIDKVNTKNIVSNLIKMRDNKTPITLKDLAIKGEDLIKIGYKGKDIGNMLNTLLYLVHKNSKHNTKQFLYDQAKFLYLICYKER